MSNYMHMIRFFIVSLEGSYNILQWGYPTRWMVPQGARLRGIREQDHLGRGAVFPMGNPAEKIN